MPNHYRKSKWNKDYTTKANMYQYRPDALESSKENLKFHTGGRYAYNSEMQSRSRYRLFYKSMKELDEQEKQNGER